MDGYGVCVGLHVVAMLLWFGHMFFGTLFSGIVIKKITPTSTARELRELTLMWGGLGWPALVVLTTTGILMLGMRGATWPDVLSGALFQSRGGGLLATKLILVAGMVLYQAVFGHWPAPRAILGNMLVACAVVGVSVLFTRT